MPWMAPKMSPRPSASARNTASVATLTWPAAAISRPAGATTKRWLDSRICASPPGTTAPRIHSLEKRVISANMSKARRLACSAWSNRRTVARPSAISAVVSASLAWISI